MIEKGIVILPEWIEKILDGSKVWEIRSKPNSYVGRVALAPKGDPHLVATCHIDKSIEIRVEEFAMYFEKHQVKPYQLYEIYGEVDVFAWPFSDVRAIKPPIKYKHPGGGSRFTVSPKNVAEWERLQSR